MPQFYAVREGRKRGIYDTWDECKSQVDGHKGAQFKKFRSRQEAEDFIAVGGSKPPVPAVRRLTPAAVPTTSQPAISVFTDGACSSNGRKGAKAGYGVFWGDGHEDNHSAPLISGPQTNNRAEYTAIIHALETAKKRDLKAIRVCTDSNLP
ncbi:Ribonuclease H [Aphelenchoides fujianensis]|nr:Ribonuclease H [Aphelenchoides fujianensis]